MRKLFSLSVLALLATTVFAAPEAKPDTLVVTPTPAMRCEKCAAKIKQNVRFVKGTKKIDISVPQQTVTIIYDGQKSTYKDFQDAFRKIGYTISRK